MVPGIIIGMLMFVFGGSFINTALNNQWVGILPGLALGVWAAWPIMHFASVQKFNLLNPVPKRYNVSAKIAFAKIRDLLAETSYNYGDKWCVVTADTRAGRIMANLRFTEESIAFASDSRKGIRTVTERLQRFIELEVNIKPIGHEAVTIQLNFWTRIEGLNDDACDSMIEDVENAIESQLGSGMPEGKPVDYTLPSPPCWLKLFTAFIFLGWILELVLGCRS